MPEKIERWQVFGNHERFDINYQLDKEKSCLEFVKIVHTIRQYTLPTEIDFINETDKRIVSLSHAFAPRLGMEETHNMENKNDCFSLMYLKNQPLLTEATMENQCSYGNALNFPGKQHIKNPSIFAPPDYMKENPQLWSDYIPKFNILVDEKNKIVEVIYQNVKQRYYKIEGSLDDVLVWRREIGLKNFLFVFALSHLWYSTKENVNNWLFACCSCHNKCLRRYNGLEYIKDIQGIRNQQVANNDERKRIFFDCRRWSLPIHALQSYFYQESLKKVPVFLESYFQRRIENCSQIIRDNDNTTQEIHNIRSMKFFDYYYFKSSLAGIFGPFFCPCIEMKKNSGLLLVYYQAPFWVGLFLQH